MSESYTLKYIKMYAAEFISILLGIVSLFVVVPYISGNKEIYGVYSLCISTMVFLSYADLGFLGASMKYAAEFYQRREKDKEIEVLAFGGFILFLIACIISIGYLVLSFNPGILIKGINDSPHLATAKTLFLWMAVLSPFIGLQRLTQCIFSIRVENYIYQFINIVGSVLRILSVFYFFSNGRYEICSYFVFIQLVPIICSFISLVIASKRYQYGFLHILKSFKWNGKCFHLTKDLALSSFLMTLSWILYYEIDQIVIAKMYGPEQVAIFAIGFSLLNYIRMFLGGLFSPFTPRFAHFKASGDLHGLKTFFTTVVHITFPIVVCPLVALSILSKNFVYAWSGPQYDSAISLTIMLVLLNLFASISYTGGSIVTVFEKTKLLRKLAVSLPVIYWFGILILPSSLSVQAFGIMKIIVFMIMVIIYLGVSTKLLGIQKGTLLFEITKYNVIPISVTCVLSLFVKQFFVITEKSFANLGLVCFSIIAITLVGYVISYCINPQIKQYCLHLLGSFNARTNG